MAFCLLAVVTNRAVTPPPSPSQKCSARAKMMSFLRQSNLSPKKCPIAVKRELQLHFALIASIKRARDDAPEGRAVIEALFQDATITKSRAKTAFRDALGVTQRFGSSPQETRFKTNARTRRNKVTPPTRDRVINFFQRDDVSRQLPSKRDYKAVSRGEAFQPRGDSVSSTTENYAPLYSSQSLSSGAETSILSSSQPEETNPSSSGSAATDSVSSASSTATHYLLMKRVLGDYIYNIYDRFKLEFPQDNVSLAVFHRLHPKHVGLCSFLKMSQCLCQIHQNFAHLLLSVKTASGTTFSLSPDKFTEALDDDGLGLILSCITTARVAYRIWKKAHDPYLNKLRFQLITEQAELEEYKAYVAQKAKSFRSHKRRVKAQYTSVKKITVKLGTDEIAAQMDYSESYACQECEMVIQSAYYTQNMVMLHPIVTYYKASDTEEIHHKSFVHVSPVDRHNTTGVIAFLKKFHREDIPKFWPRRKFSRIHYVTDSPTSQYRNKFIFWLVANHRAIFGMDAVWHFLEAGHGKGPCDGVGGSLKKMARDATKQGKQITNGNTFYLWATKLERTLVSFNYLDVFDYCSVYSERPAVTDQLKAVKGTFEIHSVMKGKDGQYIAHRETSCPCDICARGDPNCECGWQHSKVSKDGASFDACDDCHSPLCVCMDKIEKLRNFYLKRGEILLDPGNNTFTDSSN